MDDFLKLIIASAWFLLSLTHVNGQCQGRSSHSATALTTAIKYITSDNYPSYYSNYIDCTTTITSPGSHRILFHVEHQDVESGYDFLSIYRDSISSGNRLHYSQTQDSGTVGVTNPGEPLIVRFTSDYSVTYGGYKVNFIAIEDQANCGGILTATTTPQQLNYEHSLHSTSCEWTISAQNTVESVQITVLFVNGHIEITEASSTTILDTSGSTYVSGQHDRTIKVTGNVGSNFVVYYNSTNSGVTGLVTAPPVLRSMDTSICYESQKTALPTARFLYSPNYPSRYPNNIDCTVTITANNTADSVSLTVNDYIVTFYDFVGIFDGYDTSYNPISLSTVDAMTSSGASVTLRFKTDNNGQERGFNISYSSVTRVIPQCNVSPLTQIYANVSEQTLLSPNYPSDYNNDVDMYWLIIKPAVSDNIVLDFRDFNVESNLDCTYDYVAIYDGACTDSVLISKFCGYDAITYEEPTGLYILVHFHTDGSIVKKGWQLVHYIGTFRDPDADDSSSGVPDFVYPVIAIAVIVIVAIIITAFIYMQNNKRRVGDGEAKPEIKRRTVSNLMSEITNNMVVPKQRYKSDKRLFSPEGSENTGITVTVIQSKPVLPHPSPHPPPNPLPPLNHDPVYPPVDYQKFGPNTFIPMKNIAPVIPKDSNLQPQAPLPPVTPGSSMIPQPFVYMTPAEARKVGIYG